MTADSKASANAVTIAQVLNHLDGPFAAVSAAVERRGFAVWVGSGISFGRAPSVGPMLKRVLEYLRQRVDPDLGDCKFRRALNEAIEMSGLEPACRSGLQFALPFANWPEGEDIIWGLSNRYSEVLDIRLQGESDDYMVWEAVDVRTTYGTLDDPDCEHLCIAMLVMEGAIIDIASANWDGLIEAAVRRLSGGARLVQVVVDPNHLRDPPARARLIKFHGCAVHCVEDPNTYRRCLIAARSQITFWDHNPAFTALRDELRTIATQSRTLMVGLSLQDTNLQSLFAAARAALPWPWPSAPAAQGHVFCEDVLGHNQINMLRVVYGLAYNAHREAIEESALLRAYAKPALLGFVLHLLSQKLASLIATLCAGGPLAGAIGELSAGINHLRNRVASVADGDRLAFMNASIRLCSRGMALFRRGTIPSPDCETYEPISPLSIEEMTTDPNLSNSGLSELAVGIALLGRGETAGKWTISLPPTGNIGHGALQATGTWEAAKPVQVYFVSSPAPALELINGGATAAGNVVILHSDDAWSRMDHAGLPGPRSPKGAPGRTGRAPVRHVSLRQLLQSAYDLGSLEKRFEEEVTL